RRLGGGQPGLVLAEVPGPHAGGGGLGRVVVVVHDEGGPQVGGQLALLALREPAVERRVHRPRLRRRQDHVDVGDVVVRQERHAVALAYARRAQRGGEALGAVVQLGVGQPAALPQQRGRVGREPRAGGGDVEDHGAPPSPHRRQIAFHT